MDAERGYQPSNHSVSGGLDQQHSAGAGASNRQYIGSDRQTPRCSDRLNPVLVTRRPDGTLGGVSLAVANALAVHLGVPIQLKPYDNPARYNDSLASDDWDVGLAARDPTRADHLAFSTPSIDSGVVTPVTRPPGRARLATCPVATGSKSTDTKTIGVSRLDCVSAANQLPRASNTLTHFSETKWTDCQPGAIGPTIPRPNETGMNSFRTYSITSFARASRFGGTVMPSAFAVLRLIANPYLVGACTGRFAGFSPLRMRSI